MRNGALLKNRISKFILLVVCVASFLLVFPTINNNINNPNMIIYFNGDEGWLMDLAWLFYSGEKRESFQGDFDVGIGLLYLTDFSRWILSRFINMTPGTHVLILRWLYLFAWIGAFIALWKFVALHFGKGWQPALAVLLLAVRPAFAYFSNNLKADPLILLLMIVGLNYALRLIDSEKKEQNIYIAIAFASLAFLVKYAGVFLLMAIIASVYLSGYYQNNVREKRQIFPEIKISWIFPSLIGLIIIVLPLLTIFFYRRKSTGFTWYEQFGFFTTLVQNRHILYLLLIGLLFMCVSVIIFLLNKSNKAALKKVLYKVNKLNSISLITCGIFLGFTLLFGYRWVISPRYLISNYAQLGPTFLGTKSISMLAEKGLLNSLLYNFIVKIKQLDPFILILFIFYLCMEAYYKYFNLKIDAAKTVKRYVLLVFLIPLFILTLSLGRIEQHHMLPFFVAMSILSIQGLYMLNEVFMKKRNFKTAIAILIAVLFISDIAINANKTVKSRLNQFHRHEDVAFEIEKWWLKNIPADTKIVADHYIRVYIPPGYRNIRTINCNNKDFALQLRRLVDEYRPELVYYNESQEIDGEGSLPPIEKILPGRRVKLIKYFVNQPGHYQRWHGAKFVIYGIGY